MVPSPRRALALHAVSLVVLGVVVSSCGGGDAESFARSACQHVQAAAAAVGRGDTTTSRSEILAAEQDAASAVQRDAKWAALYQQLLMSQQSSGLPLILREGHAGQVQAQCRVALAP